MTVKEPAPPGKKMHPALRALIDFVILCLFLAAAGFGGYFWGVHQQLAPVLKVAAGTPGAFMPAPIADALAGATGKKSAEAVTPPGSATATADTTASTAPAKSTPVKAEESAADQGGAKTHGPKKYWLSSSGVDYIGYSITARVNGNAVDSFFGPGKLVDITRLVKAGDNTLECEAKQMGEQYNKHSGDDKAKLTIQLVSGAHISDNFKKSDVINSYERKATDTEDANDTMHFTGD